MKSDLRSTFLQLITRRGTTTPLDRTGDILLNVLCHLKQSLTTPIRRSDHVSSYTTCVITRCTTRLTIDSLTTQYRLDRDHFVCLFGRHFNITPGRCRGAIHVRRTHRLLISASLAIDRMKNVIKCRSPLCFDHLFQRAINLSPQGFRGGPHFPLSGAHWVLWCDTHT